MFAADEETFQLAKRNILLKKKICRFDAERN